MNRAKLNYFVDLGLLVSFLLVFITGVIKFKNFGLYKSFNFAGINTIHDWSGIALGIFALLHLILHWNWIISMTKSFFNKEDEKFFGYKVSK